MPCRATLTSEPELLQGLKSCHDSDQLRYVADRGFVVNHDRSLRVTQPNYPEKNFLCPVNLTVGYKSSELES